MWDHVTIRVSHVEASVRFYETVLGRAPTGTAYREWDDFSIAQADGGHPLTRHVHVAFAAESREDVERFWQAGVDAGYESDGEPGVRLQYHPDYYGAFLLDPDGNSAESVFGHRRQPGPNVIDHLWIRVADVSASERFWRTVAPVVGLEIHHDLPDGFHVVRGNRSFALLRDDRPRTENVHIAFPAPDDATVAEFHRVATAGGYRDNGPPGERLEYHRGYVGAFVLDPDGHNVEAVNHNRP
jgi:catechol 2,3-dioxygenase-like lactoylglutathione lyase family enzyme